MRAWSKADYCIKVTLFCLIAVLLTVSQTARADFTVDKASGRFVSGMYVVDASTRLPLTDDTKEALSNGVPLIIVVEISIDRQRKYIWDKNVITLRRGYKLEYHALSEKYLLTNLVTDQRKTFQSPEDATSDLQNFEALPVIQKKRLNPDYKHRAHLRVELDVDSLPAPLRLATRFSPQWWISSDWYSWNIVP